jgi:hypothetical protein
MAWYWGVIAVRSCSGIVCGLALLIAGVLVPGCGKDETPAQLEAVGLFLGAFCRHDWDGLIAASHPDVRDGLAKVRQQYGARAFGPADPFVPQLGLPGDVHEKPGIRELELVGRPEKRGDTVRVEVSYVGSAGGMASQSRAIATLSRDGEAWRVVSMGGMRVDAWMLDGVGW